MGYSWPGVFLLGASGSTGRFFTQLLFHDLISVSYRFSLRICICCIDQSSRAINRTLGLKGATPKGCVCVVLCQT